VWKLKEGETVEVSLRRYGSDFNDMVGQLQDLAGMPYSHYGILVVRGKKLDTALRSWAEKMEPDWDRYPGSVAYLLHGKGLIDNETYSKYDSTKGFAEMERALAKTKSPERDVYKLGFQLYVDSVGKGILREPNMPPVLTLKGKPLDGRHRVLAAIKLKRKVVPVAEIVESKPAAR
jgi:hypothetical protein